MLGFIVLIVVIIVVSQFISPTPTTTPPPPPPLAQQVQSSYTPATQSALTQSFSTTGVTISDLQFPEYLDHLFGSVNSQSNVNSNLGLPGYSYFQGLILSNSQVQIVGQLRVVGGVSTQASLDLMRGAMITANPESLVNRLQPNTGRWHVDSWQED